ncbi:MAG: CpsD/CapB family tyrosine-protein kinase [Eubacteriales bacterium]
MIKKKQERREHVIMHDTVPFPIKEAYKAARTNLRFMLQKHTGGKAVVFTSPLMRDGKTTTCVNMAIAFAQAGTRVLIIDADMRKPQVHAIMHLPMADGLTDALLDVSTLPQKIKDTQFPHLKVLTVGTIPPNPAELLLSDALEELLRAAEADFEYIFIDTPPIGIVTDAAIIGNKTLGAVIVSRQGITNKPALKKAVQALEQAGARPLAHMLNGVVPSRKSYKYSGYRYRYDYKYEYK